MQTTFYLIDNMHQENEIHSMKMNVSFTFKITFNCCLFDMFEHAVQHAFF